MSDIRCIGVGTGGGDAPGLNAVIRAVVKAAILKYKWKVIGILPRGGIILGTTNRGNPFKYKTTENGQESVRDISDEVIANAKKLGMDAIITVGGDGSQKIALELFHKGMRIVAGPRPSITISARRT
jgi:6-phosphofructokinase 1